MGERVSTDGGTILALRQCHDDQVGENVPEAGTVLVYYKNGVGLRLKIFGEDATDIGSGGGGGSDPLDLAHYLALDKQTTDPAAALNKGKLYTKAVGGITQLHYIASDGTIYQITSTTPISPLTTKGDLFTYSTTGARLGVGTPGQILSADSGQATGLKWIDPPATSPLTTKGDIYTFDTDNQRLPVVVNQGWVLTVDSVEATGIKWAAPHPLNAKGQLFGFSSVAAAVAPGSNGQVLSADSTQATGLKYIDLVDPTAWHYGGDAFGADKKLGTTDAHDLFLYARNFNSVKISDGTADFHMTIGGTGVKATALAIKSTAGVGADADSGIYIYNTGGSTAMFRFPDTGSGTGFAAKAGYLTISTTSAFGVRVNVNSNDDSGFAISSSKVFTMFATEVHVVPGGGSLAFFGASAQTIQSVGAVTNSVTSGGTDGTINDVGAATTDTSAAKLTDTRNAIYQLARSVRQIAVSLRAYGLVGD